MSVITNGEAVGPVITFAPPAVHDAQVQTAVASGFLAARARCLQRTPRIVQPDVASRNHLPRDVNIIILNEHQIAFEFAEFAEVNDALDVTLAIIIARMRLAGKNELHRPLGVVDQLYDAFKLIEYQRRPLVSGKPPG